MEVVGFDFGKTREIGKEQMKPQTERRSKKLRLRMTLIRDLDERKETERL